MSRRHAKVVVGAPAGSDDDLLLPRPPGVLRRFWGRHPLLTDILIALLAAFLSLPAATVRSSSPRPATTVEVSFAVGLVLLAGIALVWRRRWPLATFLVCSAPLLLMPPSLVPTFHIVAAFALYAVAVYRSVRTCWICFGSIIAALTLYTLFAWVVDPGSLGYSVGNLVSAAVGMLVAALIGVNIGNRRRYLDALIDRSRQLAVERDQQARLAAAAERTRIAREMHDIVSHSLTVIVALSEGAAAAAPSGRGREASLSAAATARGALEEMRAMLGVLRDGTEDASPLSPLEPVSPAEVVATAQRAGYPVVSEISGDVSLAPRSVRFALGRVVQEAVTNSMRHATGALEIEVRVRATEAAVDVEVRDDAPAASVARGSGGYGLQGLRERVDLIGGTLEAGPLQGGGWRVRAHLPLPRESEASTP